MSLEHKRAEVLARAGRVEHLRAAQRPRLQAAARVGERWWPWALVGGGALLGVLAERRHAPSESAAASAAGPARQRIPLGALLPWVERLLIPLLLARTASAAAEQHEAEATVGEAP